MVLNGIQIIFNPSMDAANWNKSNPRFINLILGFLSSQKIVEIYVNSAFRPEKNGSFHYAGMALDLHYVKYQNGKIVYFSRRESKYKASDDTVFSNAVKNYFDKYRIEYFSPANMISQDQDRYNKYLSSDLKVINQKLADKRAGLKIDLDAGHLDHLHLAVNPDPTAKIKGKVKSFVKSVLPAAIFFLQ